MSLDRKKALLNKYSKHLSLDEPSIEIETTSPKNFLTLSPENLNLTLSLNRSCQQLNKSSVQQGVPVVTFPAIHHGNKRKELLTRSSTESKDTDSSTESKKHGHRSRSPNHTKKSSPSR